jgi:hypothetical protein
MSRPTFTPADACRLLSDRKLVAFGCDVTRNKAFAKADARTKDALGKRVADYVRSPAEREAWPYRIAELLRLPAREFEEAMSDEPVKLSPIDKADGGTRIVGVPTFRRRCVGNVIKMILSITGDHLLPPTARAYRPNSEDAVKRALLDVASAVHNGRLRYWVKLDFSSYFSVMPWSGIEAALRHHGYEDEFIRVVMAIVRCPLVKKNKIGRTISVPNERGAQMGLAESATLANMLPFALDEHFARIAGRVFYMRYCDDLFIGAATKSDVVGAVRAVQRWCNMNGIGLKATVRRARNSDLGTVAMVHVDPKMNAEKLVIDVKNTRIALLGAEIDANGAVRLPVGKLKEKLNEITQRLAHVQTENAIEGVSLYGNGGGTHLFDLDDVEDTILSFLSYWTQLDPEGTDRAAALIRKTFPMPASPRSGGQGVAWIAQLWDSHAGGGVEVMIPAGQDPSEPTDAELRPLRGRSRASGPLRVRSTERSAKAGGTPGLGPIPEEESVDADSLYTEMAADLHTQDEEDGSSEGSLSYDEGDDDSLRDADGRETNSFSFTSMDLSALSLLRAGVFREIAGAVDDPREEPPLPVDLENTLIVHIVAERLPAPGGPRSIVGFGVVDNGMLIGKPALRTVFGRRESAAVREMSSMISVRPRHVIFAMNETWLAKALLKPHRRFRAPLLYTLVADLHERARAAHVAVTVVGGIPQPLALAHAVAQAGRMDAVRSARPTKQTL